MTSVQRSAIANPTVGLMVYQTDGAVPGYYFFNGNDWISLMSATAPIPGTCILSTNTTPPTGYSYSGNSFEVNDLWENMTGCITPRFQAGICEYNGSIYMFGGLDAWGGAPLNSIEKYNTYTNSWSVVGSLQSARYQCSVGLVNDELFIFGGMDQNGFINTVEKFNPSNLTSTVVGTLPLDGFSQGIALGIENQDAIYLFEGFYNNPQYVYAYYPISNIWSQKASISDERWRIASGGCVYASKIYIFGGYQGGGITSMADVYNPLNNTWTSLQNLPNEYPVVGAALANNLIYIICHNNNAPGNFNFEFSPSTQSYQIRPGPSVLRTFSGVASSFNYVYLIGGVQANTVYNSNERYSRIGNKFYYIHCYN